MKEGQLFSHARPNSPEYGSVVESFRKTERDRLQRSPEPESPPITVEADRYLESKGLHTPEDKLKHEYELAKHLGEAVLFRQTKDIEALRKTILMISNRIHGTANIPLEETNRILKEKIRDLMETPIHHLGESSRDIQERIEQHDLEILRWRAILGALQRHLTGKELYHALRGQDETHEDESVSIDPLADFEYEYTHLLRNATVHHHRQERKKTIKELSFMRTVRDRLYFNLLYPNLADMHYRSLGKQHDKQK